MITPKRIKFVQAYNTTIAGNIINMKLFPQNYIWLNGGKFNLDIKRYEDSSVHHITQTVLERYDEDTDIHHLIVNEFSVYGLYADTHVIEILRMGLINPHETIDLVNVTTEFKKL